MGITHARYSISCDIVDELVSSEGTGTTQLGYHPSVKGPVGSSHITNNSMNMNTAVTTVGYTNGSPDYLEADEYGGTHTSVGVDTIDYTLVFIKHSGYLVKTEGASPVELGVVTTRSLQVYTEYSSGNYAKICVLPPGGGVVLPLTSHASNATFAVKGASGLDHIAVEYLLVIGS